MRPHPRGWVVFRGNVAFTWLWWSQTVSVFGSQVTLIAIPLLAATTLHAGPFEMGLLAAVETVPYLIFSIPAGVMVDRWDRRRLLLITNVGRAALLLAIPGGAVLGILTLPLLYGVAFCVGTLSVIFDVGHQSFVPDVLEADQLLAANQRIELSESAARSIGPGIGGALVAAFGAAIAVTVDAASYLVAAVALLGARAPKRGSVGADQKRAADAAGESEADAGSPIGMILDVWDYVGLLDSRVRDLEARLAPRSLRSRLAGPFAGANFVLRDRVLRDLAASTATFNLASSAIIAVFILYATGDLGLDAAGVGILFAAGNVGFVVGALPVGAITARLGVGPVLALSGVLGAAATAMLPLASGPSGVVVLLAGRFIGALSIPLFNVNARALRQSRAPREMLGRVNAVFRLLDWGTVPIGALLGGGLGSAFGLRSVLVVGAALGAMSAIWLIVSPLRAIRRLDGAEGASPGAAEPRAGRAWQGTFVAGAGHVAAIPFRAIGRLPSIRWAWLAIGAALLQLAVFLPGLNAYLGAAPPFIYAASNVAVLACVIRNVRIPGLALTALGGLSNLAAILANGGYMPVSPEAAAIVGHTPVTTYTNTVVAADPALKVLTDIIAVPHPLPFANVYSVGDLLIVVGLAVTVAWAIHGGQKREEDPGPVGSAVAAPTPTAPDGAAPASTFWP